MADKYTLLRREGTLEVSPQFDTFTRVIIKTGQIDEETKEEIVCAWPPLDDPIGNTGRQLEMDNPLGTVEMAKNILQRLWGYQYQPYKASGALLDPSAEIGDGVSVKDIYGGIYKQSRKFGNLMRADIESPHDEEVDHEYKFESPTERKYKREMGGVRATLILQAGQIEARVTKEGGNENRSFAWKLDDSAWALYANGDSDSNIVFKADKNGVKVKGQVDITSGTIGDAETNGFHISATAIWNGISEFGSDLGNGIYLGTDGIQLGRNFKVDSTGNLEAASGRFTGTVYANKIAYDGDGNPAHSAAGTMSGGGLTGGSVPKGKLSTEGQNGVDGGKEIWGMLKEGKQIGFVNTKALSVQKLQATWQSRDVMSANGNPITINYLGYASRPDI